MNALNVLYLIPVFGVIALLYTYVKSRWVESQDAGNSRMKEIAGYIADGAIAFLRAEYKVLTYFVIITAILLGVMGASNANSHWSIGLAFVLGAVFSALAGNIGMRIATKANVRTAEAARTSLSKALNVSFTGGAVMGMGVAGLAVLGLGALFLVLVQIFAPAMVPSSHEMEKAIEILTGFSLGAESIALFARVGGGIYTKAADVGADLVGKVEAGIPEDDPRNPATIADNVGDNVGDVAGMGADLFGSYVATVLATMVLGRETVSEDAFNGMAPILLPMMIAGVGIILSMIGTLFVKITDGMTNATAKVQKALNMGNWGSIILTAICSFFLVHWMLPDTMNLRGIEFTKNGVIGAILVGLVVGTLMSIITEYYTAMGKRPVMSIVRQSKTGHATNIIGGLSVGMESTLLPILVLAGGIYGSYLCAGLYGVAIAAAGMMATTGMQLAIDAFGPIADNAGGIAEMSDLPADVREKTDILDAVGNTTAATGKGFAIASAALTALALFAAFVGISGIDGIDIYKADVLAGLFVGAMIPYIFSSLCIRAVGEAAMAMVNEVRRQFREIPGILEGKGKPEYEKCVAISTQASLQKMMLPGAIAIVAPILIGFIFGPEVLGGFLAGATVSGVLIGMFQNNAGGAWDNAKKSFEKGVDIDGETYYKGSDPHKASVTGDTVGDPFKDTSGPSMNILIKLMSIVSLVIAPTISQMHAKDIQEGRIKQLTSMMASCKAAGCTEEECGQVMGSMGGEEKTCCMPGGKQEAHQCDGNCTPENCPHMKEEGPAKLTMADGSSMDVSPDGLENTFYQFIKTGDYKSMTEDQLKQKWFDFDKVQFAEGSSALTADSKKQLDNLVAILKDNKSVHIKIGGYTDKVGDESKNKSLSTDRAYAVSRYLVSKGVGDQVKGAEGYGSEFAKVPVSASNEERASDRRMSIRLTKE